MIGTEGIVEHLVSYAKRNLLLPQARFADLGAATRPPGCCEVNAVVHAEICARRASRADTRSPMAPTATSGWGSGRVAGRGRCRRLRGAAGG
jgi:hypothetical protein